MYIYMGACGSRLSVYSIYYQNPMKTCVRAYRSSRSGGFLTHTTPTTMSDQCHTTPNDVKQSFELAKPNSKPIL